MSAPSTDTAAIRQVIRALKAAGFRIESVWNGAEEIPVKNETEMMREVTSVDMGTIYFLDDGGHSRFVEYVLGNSEGCDAIVDYGISNPKFAKVLDDLIDSWI